MTCELEPRTPGTIFCFVKAVLDGVCKLVAVLFDVLGATNASATLENALPGCKDNRLSELQQMMIGEETNPCY